MDQPPNPAPANEGSTLPPAPAQTGSEWSGLQPTAPTPFGAPAPPPSAARRWWPVIAALGVAVVAGAVVFLLLNRDASPLPDELAGEQRVTSGPMAEAMSAFEDFEMMGVTFDMGVYGGELLPTYMVMVINGQMPGTDPESLLTTLPSGIVSQNGATVDFSRAISDQVGDTEYVCVPATSDQPTVGFGEEMTMCVFQGGDSSGIVMSFLGQDLQALMGVTQELYGEL
jgi:hypothetical protein